jgi:hypothetical protein
VVPITRNASRVYYEGWEGIFYQTERGNLAARANPLDTEADSVEDLQPLMNLWKKFPEIRLSEKASFAAFSVARDNKGDAADTVDTYLLYQDGTEIKQVVLDNDESWKESSPKALAKADKGTAISCISTPTWGNYPVIGERLLEPASSLSRCYFQKDNELVQVVLGEDGGWTGPTLVFSTGGDS